MNCVCGPEMSTSISLGRAVDLHYCESCGRVALFRNGHCTWLVPNDLGLKINRILDKLNDLLDPEDGMDLVTGARHELEDVRDIVQGILSYKSEERKNND